MSAQFKIERYERARRPWVRYRIGERLRCGSDLESDYTATDMGQPRTTHTDHNLDQQLSRARGRTGFHQPDPTIPRRAC
jgi:hypothetical protein